MPKPKRPENGPEAATEVEQAAERADGAPERPADGLRGLDEGSRSPDSERRVEQAGAPPPILPTDRGAAIGHTGTGKSELLAHLWSIYRAQRVLVDVNDAYELGPASVAEENGGAIHAERVADIDWRARTVHFVPRAQSERLYNDLYAALWARALETRALCVWLDESFGPTTASQVPRWLRTAVTQGRKYGLFHLAAMQEPVNVAPILYTQANHVWLFKLAGRPDDLRRLEHRFGLRADELARALERLPEFGYLWSVLGSTDVYEMDPLPRDVLDFTRRHVVIP